MAIEQPLQFEQGPAELQIRPEPKPAQAGRTARMVNQPGRGAAALLSLPNDSEVAYQGARAAFKSALRSQ